MTDDELKALLNSGKTISEIMADQVKSEIQGKPTYDVFNEDVFKKISFNDNMSLYDKFRTLSEKEIKENEAYSYKRNSSELFDILLDSRTKFNIEDLKEHFIEQQLGDPFEAIGDEWIGFDKYMKRPDAYIIKSYLLKLVRHENLTQDSLVIIKSILDMLENDGNSHYQLTLKARKAGRLNSPHEQEMRSYFDIKNYLDSQRLQNNSWPKEAAVQELIDSTGLSRTEIYNSIKNGKEKFPKLDRRAKFSFCPDN